MPEQTNDAGVTAERLLHSAKPNPTPEQRARAIYAESRRLHDSDCLLWENNDGPKRVAVAIREAVLAEREDIADDLEAWASVGIDPEVLRQAAKRIRDGVNTALLNGLLGGPPCPGPDPQIRLLREGLFQALDFVRHPESRRGDETVEWEQILASTGGLERDA